ncbi:MAG: hypothetical protein KF768_12955 [Phycisphaeraceae bacterium]|nr:hypothetical protein [Phycisphaeraceae bacterium]
MHGRVRHDGHARGVSEWRARTVIVLIATMGWLCAGGGCGGPHGRELVDLNALIVLPDTGGERDVNAWKERTGTRPLRIGVARFRGERFRWHGRRDSELPALPLLDTDTGEMVEVLGGRSRRDLEFHVAAIPPPVVDGSSEEGWPVHPEEFWRLARASDVDLVLVYTIGERHDSSVATILLTLLTLGLIPEMAAHEDRSVVASVHDLSGGAPLFRTDSEYRASQWANAWTMGSATEHAASRASSRVHRAAARAIAEWLRSELTVPTTEKVTWPADI